MVCILLGKGFEESEALVPADVLRRAGVEVVLTSLEGLEVTSSHGISVKADKQLSEILPSDIELLFLPGGAGGVDAIKSCPAALSLIEELAGCGYIAAICAGPTILGQLGLLKGRRAVCFPGMEDQLIGAQVEKGSPVVQDGKFISGEAAGSALPFGLSLVSLLKGRTAAEEVAQTIHYHGSFDILSPA